MKVFVFIEYAIFERQVYGFFLHLKANLSVVIVNIEKLRDHREKIEISNYRAHYIYLSIN